MPHPHRSALALALALAVAAPIARAGEPLTLRFQSRVTDAGGAPLTQTGLSVTTSLYSTALGGTPFWTETRVVDVQGGLVAFDLGDVTALDSELVAGPLPVFVGVTLGTDSEMVPRLRLNALPLAKHADTATSATTAVSADAATTAGHAATADQAVSADFATSAGTAASADFATSAASATSADDVPGKTINPKDIRIGGQYVIDKFGQWVGDPAGLQGPQGPAGPQGKTGPSGPQGVQGPAGPAGDSHFNHPAVDRVDFVGSLANAHLRLLPDNAVGGGSSQLTFSKDVNGAAGMSWNFAGHSDRLTLFGFDGASTVGPISSFDGTTGNTALGVSFSPYRLGVWAGAGTPALEVRSGLVQRLEVNANGGVSLGGGDASVPGGATFVAGSLGIGDPTPDAELDVEGDVLVTGQVLAATEDRKLTFQAGDFNPSDEMRLDASGSSPLFQLVPNGDEPFAFARIQLPDGALITAMRAIAFDSNNLGDVEVTLQRQLFGQFVSEELALMSTFGSTVQAQTIALGNLPAYPIDNDQYAYFLRVEIPLGTNLGSGRTFVSAQIDYRTPQSLR